MIGSRTLARPLMATMFVAGGIDALRNPGSKVPEAQDVTDPITERVDQLPDDTETLVKVNGAVQIAAGCLLALGKLPRLAALALAGSLVPTTLAGHRFWEEDDDEARAGQQVHFFKNLSMLGGLILAATDTGGRPSLPWRAQRAGRRVAESLPVGGS